MILFKLLSLYVLFGDPKKAFPLELHYNSNCLRDAHHTRKKEGRISDDQTSDLGLRNLCDAQIIMYLQSCLCTEPFWTDVTTMNIRYNKIRKESGM